MLLIGAGPTGLAPLAFPPCPAGKAWPGETCLEGARRTASTFHSRRSEATRRLTA